MMMKYSGWLFVLIVTVVFSIVAVEDRSFAQEGGEDAPSVDIEALEPRIQALKEEIVELNTLLFKLQEDLLFPEDSSVVVFLSVEGDHYFDLDSVKLTLDDRMVSSYLYTAREKSALKKGGIQRLYTGNVRSGEHQLVAVFNGLGPQNVDYKRAETLNFQKKKGPLFIKLIVRDNAEMKRVEFTYETWD
ncbi:MAG: AraC family transcriptional regulator [Nitrospiria bacterium]